MARLLSLIVSLLAGSFTAGGVGAFVPSPKTERNGSPLFIYSATPCGDGGDDGQPDNSEAVASRRRFFASALAATALTLLGEDDGASAYDKTYPGQLDASDGELVDERQRRVQKVLDKQESKRRLSLFGASPVSKVFGSFLWAGALWFISGSRSNPVVTPLANAIYNEEEEVWLKDRNEGLFANLPLPLFALLALVFLVAGFGFDSFITNFFAGGDRDLNLELAGVSLISGGALELGRIASGEKKLTRKENDRDMQLEREFQEFAANRLKPGGNCHKNEIVSAFRRYYAKYRQADHPEYGLSDVEIERLVRGWSRTMAGIEMSSAGFFSGFQINQDADAFTATR